ncbi:MAG: Rrf2 family transcriptional regulator [Alphaproteobacteria bacterium]
MNLGTKARYAVMAMVELSGKPKGKPVKLAELADAQEMTVPYLEQIFGKLRQAGLVESVRGPGGGYVLAKKADSILIADIICAVEESVKMTRCESHINGGCMAENTRCATHDLWEGLQRHIADYLQSVTLADVRDRKVVPDVVLGNIEVAPPPS